MNICQITHVFFLLNLIVKHYNYLDISIEEHWGKVNKVKDNSEVLSFSKLALHFLLYG